KGELVLVRNKTDLLHELGTKRLSLRLRRPLTHVPEALIGWRLELSGDGNTLTYTYDNQAERPGVASLLRDLESAGVTFRDIDTEASSLDEICVHLVRKTP
ncbi:MAG: multidrug ABC transporter ATP-binding protein, partial [Mesorhizobium sp.]